MKQLSAYFHKRLLIALSLSGLLVIACIYRHTVITSTSYYYTSFGFDTAPTIDKLVQQHPDVALSAILGYHGSNDQFLQQLQQLRTEKDQVQRHLYRHLDAPYGFDTNIPEDTWEDLPTRGVIYMLVTNEDVSKVRLTMREFQDRMATSGRSNVQAYPWVFLNVQKFTPEFKRYVSKMLPSDDPNRRKVFFGQIDLEAWSFPEWIDVKRTEEETMQQIMKQQNTKHVISLTKKQAMRYQTGLFFHHPLFNNVDYVLRLEPGASFPCDIAADPFEIMKKENKKLGFTITTKDDPATGFSLWPATEAFMKGSFSDPSFIIPANQTIRSWLFNFEDGKVQYNFCHLSSAFELIDLSFVKSEGYTDLFQYLDLVGGFFYERWSDGAVRTIAASLFLQRNDLHFFNDIGYSHSNIQHCPFDSKSMDQCLCDMKRNTNLRTSSCTMSLLKRIDTKQLEGVKQLIRERLPELIDKKNKHAQKTAI